MGRPQTRAISSSRRTSHYTSFTSKRSACLKLLAVLDVISGSAVVEGRLEDEGLLKRRKEAGEAPAPVDENDSDSCAEQEHDA
ncbi:unnamed protein product, partial [Amoebophrya sp. A25]|eukprot:GSA25T00008785001.1